MLDYQALAVSRLASQFQKSPKLKGLVAAMVGPLAVIEGHADDLISQRWIETAIGAQLDGAGFIVGEPRLGREDEAYREAIRFRVFVNTSNATPTDLIRGLKYFSSPTDCQYIEMYPATAILFTNGLFVTKDIQPTMQDLAPVAISDLPVMVSFGSKPFRFGKTTVISNLAVNNPLQNLHANGSNIQVTAYYGGAQGESSLGGVIPSRLNIGIGHLNIGGPFLAVYNPNTTITLGHDNLTGVFQ